MGLKLIGAGFGRTGTKSLQAALERLGYGPCYHMTEVMRNPDHVQQWLAATQGDLPDWQAFFADYQATVDWPGCTYYHELMQAFPEAKVLLSVRDPEKWYESCIDTIYGVSNRRAFKLMRRLAPPIRRIGQMLDNLIWHGTFDGRFDDKDYAISVFNAHNTAVRQTVPADKLLIYSVKEGWEPLCAFLEVPVPDEPFPHLNDRDSFQKMLRQNSSLPRKTLRRLGLGLALAAAVGLLRQRRAA